MRAVTPAEQEYLETLLQLFEADQPLTAANLSRALGLSAPTVHEMVKRLETDALIERDERKRISFTADGLAVAREAASRHRLVERFLTDVLHIPWHEVHEEAEKIDQAMSPTVAARMREAIGTATTCPHGHPIAAGNRVHCGTRLTDVPVGERVTVLRFENEHADVTHALHDAGLRLGLGGTVVDRDADEMAVDFGAERPARLSVRVADTVAVWAFTGPATAPPVQVPDEVVRG
jgi:DtxR family Mn-dependent transcriptional regulator